MNSIIGVQDMDEAFYIIHGANNPGKGMKITIPHL